MRPSLFDIIQKVLGWIIRLAPLGVLGLIGNAFATYGNQFIKPLFSLIWPVYPARCWCCSWSTRCC